MDVIKFMIDFVLHLDHYLNQLVLDFGGWTYLILWFVIFMETGFVVTPFLPGDSLLFAAGALTAAVHSFNIWILWPLVFFAAVLGDTVNYAIGHYIGPKAFSGNIRFLKKEYLDRTQAFYEKHGGITIFLARFIPIIRTFAPFVAGVGIMRYSHFIIYNILGGFIWTTLFLWGGYFFGNLKFVADNFSVVIIAIVLISVLPAVIEYLKGRKAHKSDTSAVEAPKMTDTAE